ncbi:hypothetical protein R1flu_024036 [Riccia fluitans]|uniref:Uncharacterized protein n=1 Tax=Riccia fluitans TaxID=41844 RepID=A0ABD1XU75_9MARC
MIRNSYDDGFTLISKWCDPSDTRAQKAIFGRFSSTISVGKVVYTPPCFLHSLISCEGWMQVFFSSRKPVLEEKDGSKRLPRPPALAGRNRHIGPVSSGQLNPHRTEQKMNNPPNKEALRRIGRPSAQSVITIYEYVSARTAARK